MKQKTCKLCERRIEPYEITLNRERLCEPCFEFLIEKYKTIEKVRWIIKQYHQGGRK
ncbi:hypothetical protein J4230_02630 [Candidatus Woesearchaeota archaeon]|nr:hypothetical protein [Candidatus Woesearchaeota archaeon]